MFLDLEALKKLNLNMQMLRIDRKEDMLNHSQVVLMKI